MNRKVFIFNNDLVEDGANTVWVVTTREFENRRDIDTFEQPYILARMFGCLSTDDNEVTCTWISSMDDDVFSADDRAKLEASGSYNKANHMMVS